MSIAAGSAAPLASRVLVVDDEPVNLALLHAMLDSAGYTDIRCTTDARSVVRTVVEWDADIVLLDLGMPQLDGYAVLQQLRFALPSHVYLPVLVLTGDTSSQAKQRALRLGANDYCTKPFDPAEVVLRVGNLLATRALHKQLSAHNELLEIRVEQRTAELEEARLEILERLAAASEYRDDATHQHTQRVGDVSALLATDLGYDAADAEILRRAAPLHDIGKIGIADEILLKPGRLTVSEFAQIKRHTEIGAQILAGSRYAILQMGEVIARTHHERWDGSGYLGLTGDTIPQAARIVAVADVFDALIHERPYKHAWPWAEALAYIRDGAATQFDPGAVAAFVALEASGRLELVAPKPQLGSPLQGCPAPTDQARADDAPVGRFLRLTEARSEHTIG